MKNYICTVCGHIYYQEMGDPDRDDIPKGTAFEKVPKDWTCPKCGASKEEFKKCNNECDNEY